MFDKVACFLLQILLSNSTHFFLKLRTRSTDWAKRRTSDSKSTEVEVFLDNGQNEQNLLSGIPTQALSNFCFCISLYFWYVFFFKIIFFFFSNTWDFEKEGGAIFFVDALLLVIIDYIYVLLWYHFNHHHHFYHRELFVFFSINSIFLLLGFSSLER